MNKLPDKKKQLCNYQRKPKILALGFLYKKIVPESAGGFVWVSGLNFVIYYHWAEFFGNEYWCDPFFPVWRKRFRKKARCSWMTSTCSKSGFHLLESNLSGLSALYRLLSESAGLQIKSNSLIAWTACLFQWSPLDIRLDCFHSIFWSLYRVLVISQILRWEPCHGRSPDYRSRRSS